MFKTYNYSQINSVIFELKNNKAVVIPTDTVIGIIANNENIIYQIKNRPKNKKIVLLVSDYKILGTLNNTQKLFLDKFWPGKVTVIKNNIAYRMPDDNYLLYILNKTGPLYCSSANLSDNMTITNTNQANTEFNIDKYYYSLILVEGESKTKLPSTIVNIDNWEILRKGEEYNNVVNFINNKDNKKTIYILSNDKQFINQPGLMNIINKNNYDVKFDELTEQNLINIAKFIRNTNNEILIISKNDSIYWDSLANKLYGIRSAIIYNKKIAILAKQHDNSNIAIFDLNDFNNLTTLENIKNYLNSQFEGGRHINRLKIIYDYEHDKYINKK